MESVIDQSKIGQMTESQMTETKELVEAYRKIILVMYKEEFASQYKKVDKTENNRSKKQKIKSHIDNLYYIVITETINKTVRLFIHLRIKKTFKKIRLLNSLESLSLLDSSEWNTQEIQNPQNYFINTSHTKLNVEMQYIEDLLPDFKDYLNNYLVLGITFAIISPTLAIFTLLLSPPFQSSGWTDWIIFGLIWFVAIVIFLFVKNRVKKEIIRIYSESMGKYNELIKPARKIEKQIFMKD